MTYLGIFKKWWFWLILLIVYIYELLTYEFTPILLIEYLGIFTGSFINVILTYSVIYFFYWLFTRKKKKKQKINI